MIFEIPYGKSTVSVEIDKERVLGVLTPNEITVERSGLDALDWSLDHPIGSDRLEDLCVPGERVVIVTSDITRPVPSAVILPRVLERLSRAGIPDRDITLVFALGSHRKHTPAEMETLTGKDVYSRIRCVDSDPSECQYVGTSLRGTNYALFKEVVEADRVICIANIEYHYFAGYSGGAKSIMPGVSDLACIRNNHSGMVKEEACAGRIEGNPVREDIDEVTRFQRIDFIVNVVLDEHKHILYAASGHWRDAHRSGCAFLDRLYKVQIPRKADIVLVSPGGFPKDINLYQAQKALDNAKHAVREGGVILWIGSCSEGLENKLFEKWMLEYEPSFMIEEIARDFQLGAHKAAAIALVLRKARIFLVSDLEEDLVRSIHLEPKASVSEALQDATALLGDHASVLVMPYGGSTLPVTD
ncbi:MAG: nickel-dependent lactate racemase [Clostridiaceae bacterium]|nr:nickel-dependent lactate racemase [Clostridiaceae bacterium]